MAARWLGRLAGRRVGIQLGPAWASERGVLPFQVKWKLRIAQKCEWE